MGLETIMKKPLNKAEQNILLFEAFGGGILSCQFDGENTMAIGAHKNPQRNNNIDELIGVYTATNCTPFFRYRFQILIFCQPGIGKNYIVETIIKIANMWKIRTVITSYKGKSGVIIDGHMLHTLLSIQSNSNRINQKIKSGVIMEIRMKVESRTIHLLLLDEATIIVMNHFLNTVAIAHGFDIMTGIVEKQQRGECHCHFLIWVYKGHKNNSAF